MIRVTKSERAELERVGLLQHRRTGINACDANFTVVNRQHKSRQKETFVIETKENLAFLRRFSSLNVQPISERQLKNLKEAKLVTDEQVQLWHTYVPNAVVFQDAQGHYFMDKITKLMVFIGVWKNNTSKK